MLSWNLTCLALVKLNNWLLEHWAHLPQLKMSGRSLRSDNWCKHQDVCTAFWNLWAQITASGGCFMMVHWDQIGQWNLLKDVICNPCVSSVFVMWEHQQICHHWCVCSQIHHLWCPCHPNWQSSKRPSLVWKRQKTCFKFIESNCCLDTLEGHQLCVLVLCFHGLKTVFVRFRFQGTTHCLTFVHWQLLGHCTANFP